MKRKAHFLIVGAGLSGACMALYLGRAGHKVDVFERRGDPRQLQNSCERAISLVLADGTLDLLEDLGLGQELLRRTMPLEGRILHFPNGAVRRSLYGDSPAHQLFDAEGRRAHALRRLELVRLLISAAEREAGVRFHFGVEVTSIDPDAATLTCLGPRGRRRIVGSAILAADGASSHLRETLHSLAPDAVFERTELHFGYRRVDLSGLPIEQAAFVHAWPQIDALLVAVPERGGGFLAAIFLPLQGEQSFESLNQPETTTSFFAARFPDLPRPDELAQSFLRRPTNRLLSLRCRPWMHRRAVLLGDACHVMVPFTGQGANTALMDCRALAHAIRRHGDVSSAFFHFAEERGPVTDAIQRHSLAVVPFAMGLMAAMPPPVGAGAPPGD